MDDVTPDVTADLGRSAAWPRLVSRAITIVTGLPAEAEVVTSIATDAPLVALTVDDGPHPATTPALLDVLARHDVRATFFVLGERVRDHPALIARAAAEGHELGNHLERDEPSARLPAAEFERQLAEVHALLTPHGPAGWFRPGSGWFTPSMIRAGAALGYRCALGSPGLAVSAYPEPTTLGERLAARCGRGDVLVLHEGSPRRAAVAEIVATLVPALRRRGLEPTTLTQLSASART